MRERTVTRAERDHTSYRMLVDSRDLTEPLGIEAITLEHVERAIEENGRPWWRVRAIERETARIKGLAATDTNVMLSENNIQRALAELHEDRREAQYAVADGEPVPDFRRSLKGVAAGLAVGRHHVVSRMYDAEDALARLEHRSAPR